MRHLRTNFLTKPTSDHPEEISRDIAELKKLAQESIKRSDQLGYQALWAMLTDEAFLRNIFFRHLIGIPKKTDRTPTTEQFTEVYNAYVDLLRHSQEAPTQLAENIGKEKLLTRIADLEAHRALYLGRGAEDITTFENAYRHLWMAFTDEVQEGKSSETALIGLLRYGPKAYAGASREQMIAMDELNPIVEATLPREDVLNSTTLGRHIADTRKHDFCLFVPGEPKIIMTFDLGIGGQGNEGEAYGGIKTSANGLSMSAKQIRDLWTAIGNPHRDLPLAGGEEQLAWKETYKEVMRSIIYRAAPEHRVTLFSLLLPRITRFKEKHPTEKNYDQTTLSYDQALTFAKVKELWPGIITRYPNLIAVVGHEINLSNWSVAKRAIIEIDRIDQSHPAIEGLRRPRKKRVTQTG